MGKEVVTLEIDAELMEQLRASGVDPAAYLERLLKRKALSGEMSDKRQARAVAWRKEHQAELDSYDRFIKENGIWSDGLRQF